MPTEVGGVTSTLGAQAVSTRATSPRTKFGRSSRNDGELMGASSGGPYEFKLLGQTNTMGTEPSSAFGRQSPSRCRTAPAHKFGLRISNDTNMKLQQPGPGAYEHPSSLGKQLLSSREKLPAYSMGSGGRFSHFKAEMKTQYLTPSALDYKPASGWLGDAPKYSFHGKGHRADISKGLPGQKPTCLEDPGPGTYHNASSLGKQVECWSACPGAALADTTCEASGLPIA
uniref:Uncharacterized protein n=1 Tax=Dunaliella tertiolecta TaxID=3047 RepID=A0A7S3VR27_DUNTE